MRYAAVGARAAAGSKREADRARVRACERASVHVVWTEARNASAHERV